MFLDYCGKRSNCNYVVTVTSYDLGYNFAAHELKNKFGLVLEGELFKLCTFGVCGQPTVTVKPRSES